MKKTLVVASVALSILLLLSIGASYTGLFYFDWSGGPGEKYSEWRMLGKVEVRDGVWSTVP